MNREEVQSMVEQMKRVQHTLAGVILSMGLALEMFDTLSTEEKEHYEQYWQEMQIKTMQDLRQLLASVEPAMSTNYQQYCETQEKLRQAVREAFTPEEIVETLRATWQLARERKSGRDMIAAIWPTLEYALSLPSEHHPTERNAALKPTFTLLHELGND
ncbi:MAG: hypothetical protein U0350_27455 [Caldilineaceae bacterium]